MITFADGVHVNLDLDGADSTIASVASFGKVSLAHSHNDLLVSLMLGRGELDAGDPRLEPLLKYEFVADKPSLDDPLIEQRLDGLAQKWSYLRPEGRAGKLFARLYTQTLRAHARRKIFVQDFGQTPCMPETAVRRAMQLGPGQLKVLLIGDDDLLSVPLALLGHKVYVYDIDDAVLIPFLHNLARDWKLSIKARRVDLMAPSTKRGGFDAMFTDPMSTRECFDLFLSRGLAWLKRDGRAFCTVHAYAWDTFENVQRDMRFELVAHHRDFNHYYEEGFFENYYRSDLVELAKTRATTPRYRLNEAAPLDLTSGELDVRYHQAVDMRAITPPHFTRAHIDDALARIKAERLIDVVCETRDPQENHDSYIAALDGGGTFALTVYYDEQLVAYDLYPYQPARDQALRRCLRRAIPQSLHKMVFRAARVDEQRTAVKKFKKKK